MMPEPSAPAAAELAVLWADPRRAVTEQSIVCLLCGGLFRQLTNTHLRAHGTTGNEYKRRFGYNRRRALMCRALRRLYTERALRTGLAERISWRPIVHEPELRRRGGMRVSTLEERLTRADRRIGNMGGPDMAPHPPPTLVAPRPSRGTPRDTPTGC